jgi:hypothetical protein
MIHDIENHVTLPQFIKVVLIPVMSGSSFCGPCGHQPYRPGYLQNMTQLALTHRKEV